MNNEKSGETGTEFKQMNEKWRWLIRVIPLGIWVLFLIFMARPFDGVIIIAFFLIFFFLRRRAFILLAAAVLVIVLFNTPVLNTLSKLRDLNLSTYHHVPPALAQLFKPGSGQEVLPIQVRQMLSLIQTHQMANYRLSKTFDEDGWISQRMTEAAWPVVKENTSPYLFGAFEEFEGYPGCMVIDQLKDVALGYCH